MSCYANGVDDDGDNCTYPLDVGKLPGAAVSQDSRNADFPIVPTILYNSLDASSKQLKSFELYNRSSALRGSGRGRALLDHHRL